MTTLRGPARILVAALAAFALAAAVQVETVSRRSDPRVSGALGTAASEKHVGEEAFEDGGTDNHDNDNDDGNDDGEDADDDEEDDAGAAPDEAGDELKDDRVGVPPRKSDATGTAEAVARWNRQAAPPREKLGAELSAAKRLLRGGEDEEKRAAEQATAPAPLSTTTRGSAARFLLRPRDPTGNIPRPHGLPHAVVTPTPPREQHEEGLTSSVTRTTTGPSSILRQMPVAKRAHPPSEGGKPIMGAVKSSASALLVQFSRDESGVVVTNPASLQKIQSLNRQISEEKESLRQLTTSCKADTQKLHADLATVRARVAVVENRMAAQEAREGSNLAERDQQVGATASGGSSSGACDKDGFLRAREKLERGEKQLSDTEQQAQALEDGCAKAEGEALLAVAEGGGVERSFEKSRALSRRKKSRHSETKHRRASFSEIFRHARRARRFSSRAASSARRRLHFRGAFRRSKRSRFRDRHLLPFPREQNEDFSPSFVQLSSRHGRAFASSSSSCGESFRRNLRDAVAALQAEVRQHRNDVERHEAECRGESSLQRREEAAAGRERASTSENAVARAETALQQLLADRDAALDDAGNLQSSCDALAASCAERSEQATALVKRLTEERNACVRSSSVASPPPKAAVGKELRVHDCEVSDWSLADRVAGCACSDADYDSRRQKSFFAVRTVEIAPSQFGAPCPANLREERGCPERCLRPVACELSQWVPWEPCSAACGGGVRSRSREVVRQAEHGGESCNGQMLSETEQCSLQPCVDPVEEEEAATTEPAAEPEPPEVKRAPSSSDQRASARAASASAATTTGGGGGGGTGTGCPLSEWSTWSRCSQSCSVAKARVRPYRERRRIYTGFARTLNWPNTVRMGDLVSTPPTSGLVSAAAAESLPPTCRNFDFNSREAVQLRECNAHRLCGSAPALRAGVASSKKGPTCAAGVRDNANDVLLVLDASADSRSFAAQEQLAQRLTEKLLRGKKLRARRLGGEEDESQDVAARSDIGSRSSSSTSSGNLQFLQTSASVSSASTRGDEARSVRVGVVKFNGTRTSALLEGELLSAGAGGWERRLRPHWEAGNWTYYPEKAKARSGAEAGVLLAHEMLTFFAAKKYSNAAAAVQDAEKEKGDKLPWLQSVPKLVENATAAVRDLADAERQASGGNEKANTYTGFFSSSYGWSGSQGEQEPAARPSSPPPLFFLQTAKASAESGRRSARAQTIHSRQRRARHLRQHEVVDLGPAGASSTQAARGRGRLPATAGAHRSSTRALVTARSGTSRAGPQRTAGKPKRAREPKAAGTTSAAPPRRKTVVLFLSALPAALDSLRALLAQMKQRHGYRVILVASQEGGLETSAKARFGADGENPTLGTTSNGLGTSELAHLDYSDQTNTVLGQGALGPAPIRFSPSGAAADDDFAAGLLPYLFTQVGSGSQASISTKMAKKFLCAAASFPCASNTAEVRDWTSALQKPEVVDQLLLSVCPVVTEW